MGQAFAAALGSELSLKLEIVGVQVGPEFLEGGPDGRFFSGPGRVVWGSGVCCRGCFFCLNDV